MKKQRTPYNYVTDRDTPIFSFYAFFMMDKVFTGHTAHQVRGVYRTPRTKPIKVEDKVIE